ncbi:MAG: hypothetical protein QW738_06660 [Nitrososphaeria archaeon]
MSESARMWLGCSKAGIRLRAEVENGVPAGGLWATCSWQGLL